MRGTLSVEAHVRTQLPLRTAAPHNVSEMIGLPRCQETARRTLQLTILRLSDIFSG